MSTTATYRLPASLAQARALDLRVIAAMIAATAWLASSITSQSLWIDEGVTAWFASQPSLQAMVHSVLAMKKTSDPQMPGYWFYIWTWCHAFGTSEVALRAANIPFAAIIAASFLTFSRRVLDSWWGCVPVVFSPFLAFYMNEARPYVAVMAMTSVAAVAAYLYFSEPTEAGSRNAWIASIAIFIACFLHMLSVFVLIALACFALLRPRSANLSLRPFLAPLLTVGPLLCLLGSYYFWTVLRGSAGAIASPGIKNLAFVFYEFAGLGGLGPSRNELRDGSTWQLIAAHAPWLLCGVLPGVILVLIFCRH